MKRRAIAAAACSLAFIWGAPCLSGTTGGISGRVVDAVTRAPLAGVQVVVTSPSGSARSATDAKGRYIFLALAPDTYTVTASRDGYLTYVHDGVTVQSDVQESLDIDLAQTTETIERILVVGRAGLVSPGQTIDVYSINPATAKAAQALAGPGGVDQAYGALAVMPGIYVPQGQQGWYQPIFIRGGDQDQIGYELDGVPVNRSYDNAPQSLLTSVGQQELQVYTGGATASSDGQGISGYVNQVVKRGTYPQEGSLTYGLGFPAGYQKAGFEYGNALPSNRFSYYIAGSLADQFYRYGDPFNAASLYQSGFFFPSFQFTASGPIDLPGITLGASETRDREAVLNFHYAVPRRNGTLGDDLQLLHVESYLKTLTYGSFNDFGGENTFGTTFAYPDQFVYSGQVGGVVDPTQVAQYLYPNTPDAGRSFQSTVNPNLRAVADNDFSLTKLQYTYNISQTQFVRVLGFRTYSNWYIKDPIPVPSTLEYILPEITFGGSVAFADQVSEKHQIRLAASVASSREFRYTTGFDFLLGGGFTPSGQIGGNFLGSALVGSYTDGTHCYDQATGLFTSCLASASQTFIDLNTGALPVPVAPPGTPALLNGARWIATENAYGGLINRVSPILTAASAEDRIRPNDKLTVNVGARVERYDDRLVDEASGYPSRQFWFNAWNNEFCVASLARSPIQRTIDPATGLASPCPAGSSPLQLSLASAARESNSVFEPRIGGTYELSNDTTLRLSYGTYARPPNASWVQYGTVQQDLATPMVQKFLAYGFTSPQHNLLPDVSHNVDFSWEQHIRGTDMSFKITPYYRGTMGQFENILLDTSGNESGVNVGSERSYGVEAAFQKGNFARDGLAGLVAFTYNYSRFRYAKFASGLNVLDLINQKIAQYNAYTSACAPGGSASGRTQFGTPLCGSTTGPTGTAAQCFAPDGTPDPSCAAGDVTNPYWTRPVQPLQDPGAPYPPYDIIPDQPLAAGNGFGPAVTVTFLGQYKHNRFTATPSIAFNSGAYYGAPLSTVGDDPAANNSSQIPIPNDFTSQFDKMGAFTQPWRLTGNLQLGYVLTQRATLSLTMTSLFDVCHQRGYAWDRADFCAYTTLPFGQAPNSSTHTSAAGDPNYQFPYTVQNGNNNTQFLGTKIPFQAYLTIQFKL